MATIKNTTSALGNLINTINGGTPPSGSGTPFSSGFAAPSATGYNVDDDSIPSGLMGPEPIFQINYKSTRKQCIKKSKDQLIIIVKEIVPQAMQNSKVILDKIEQDAEQLGSLYYEYEKTEKMIQAAMETVSRGEVSPRMFDVYQKLSSEQSSLISKITATQNSMRKYYIDICMDIQQKDELDDNHNYKALPQQEEEPQVQPMQNIIAGTDQTIKMLNERKRQAMIAKYEEIKDNEK